MDRLGKVARRRQLRKANKIIVRRELLITEYVRHKYNDIYSEAAQFYQDLDNAYPDKHDLRKTQEYKAWRLSVERAHANIQTPDEIVVKASTTGSRSLSPGQSEQQESPSSTPDQSEQQEAQPPTEKHPYVDNLQLRIPLMPYTSPKNHPTTSTETPETVTEEMLAVDAIRPSLCEELPQDLFEKIISELRTEPELKDIFTNIQEQHEFEQIGLDIYIPEHEQDLLEIELENS